MTLGLTVKGVLLVVVPLFFLIITEILKSSCAKKGETRMNIEKNSNAQNIAINIMNILSGGMAGRALLANAVNKNEV